MNKLIVCSNRKSGKYIIEKRNKFTEDVEWKHPYLFLDKIVYCNSKKESIEVCDQLSKMFLVCEFRYKKFNNLGML